MKATVRLAVLAAASLFLFSFGTVSGDGPGQGPPVAQRADLYCTGFIAEFSPRPGLQVIGGEKESFQNTFAQGDVVYLNQGRAAGIQPGASYYVIRPLGEVKHPFAKKKLGHFVRELGILRVLEVQEQTAVAEILVSCDQIEFGDMLRPYEAIDSPDLRDPRPLPRYSESSGGVTGQIVLSPQYREYFSANNLVFIDLGNRQGVQSGDTFTIFRKIGKSEQVARVPEDDIVQERSGGFESDHYRGGDFAQAAGRVPRNKVLKSRPALPRKVLGELVILRVEKNTAVGYITRTTAEVNLGDYVEKSN